MADMRTALIKDTGITKLNETKGKAILAQAWKTHGYDQLSGHRVYSLQGKDVWKGMMGKMGKPWPEAQSELALRYVIGSFDGQVHFLDGKRQGEKAGLQSWHYYEIDSQGKVEFKERDERIIFGLTAYQYFFEMLDRLKKSPIISYAGEKEFRGETYDLVFTTWETPEPHMGHDQYVLWINQRTHMMDFAVYSLRENYLKIPGYKSFYGSMEFSDFRTVAGMLIPFEQTVYLNSPKKKQKRHVHQMIVESFEFDGFDESDLYPNPKLERVGDSKEKGASTASLP